MNKKSQQSNPFEANSQEKKQNFDKKLLLFPFFLVLYEFSVYIANDMIQPAMLLVVQEFLANADWIPTALTAFIIGGGLFPWLLGPLSDRFGRRLPMFFGVSFFILSCFAILLASSIENFMFLRVLQGIGVSFITVIGYATIQEAFEERTAIRVMALMANIALIAPLAGPLMGAWVIQFAPWRMIFIIIAVLASISLIGLYFFMPETVDLKAQKNKQHDDGFMKRLFRNYRSLFSSGTFIRAALVPPLLALPILAWIGVGPMILMDNFKLSPSQFAYWQIPIFTALILGNLMLAKVASSWPLDRTLRISLKLLILVAIIMGLGIIFSPNKFYFLVLATTLFAFAEGIAASIFYRFALTASQADKGITSAGVGFFFTIIFACGIELFKLAFLHFHLIGYGVLMIISIIITAILASRVIKESMAQRKAKFLD